MDSIDITAIAPKIEKFVKKEGKLLSASSLTLPPLSPLPLGSWSTCLSPYVQGPWLWSHLLSQFFLLPFPILISLLHPFPLYSVSHPPLLFSRLGPRLTSLHVFACVSSLMPVSSILARVFLSEGNHRHRVLYSHDISLSILVESLTFAHIVSLFTPCHDIM